MPLHPLVVGNGGKYRDFLFGVNVKDAVNKKKLFLGDFMSNLYEKLAKGLAVYKKTGSKFYWCYLQVPTTNGKKKRKDKSLKTTDFEEAKKLAFSEQLKYEVADEMGFDRDDSRPSFKKVANEFHDLVWNEDNGNGNLKYTYGKRTRKFKDLSKRTMEFIQRTLIPNLGTFKIEELKTKQIGLALRRETDPDEIAKSTLQTRISVLNKIFQYALEEDYIYPSQIPALPKIKTRKRKVRKSFTDLQVFKINNLIKEVIRNSRSKISIENRKLFYYAFNINLNTGARFGVELLDNIFSDIEKHYDGDNHFYTLHIYQGKTQNYAQSRKMVLKLEAIMFLNQLTYYKYNCSLDYALENHSQKHIFYRMSDNKLPLFHDNWDDIRERCIKKKIIDKKEKELFTLYSTRHTYCTTMLLSSVAKGRMSLHDLCVQLGTGLKNIQDSYSHVTSLMNAKSFVSPNDERIESLYHKEDICFEDIHDIIYFKKTGEIRKKANEDLDTSFDKYRIKAKQIENKYKIDLDNPIHVENLLAELKENGSVKEIEENVKLNRANRIKGNVKERLSDLSSYCEKYLKEKLIGTENQVSKLFSVLEQSKDTVGLKTLINVLSFSEMQLSENLQTSIKAISEYNSPVAFIKQDNNVIDINFINDRKNLGDQIRNIEDQFDIRIRCKSDALDFFNLCKSDVSCSSEHIYIVNQFIDCCEEYEILNNKVTDLKQHVLFTCLRHHVSFNRYKILLKELSNNDKLDSVSKQDKAVLQSYSDFLKVEDRFVQAVGIDKQNSDIKLLSVG
jgi:hypothetical protein